MVLGQYLIPLSDTWTYANEISILGSVLCSRLVKTRMFMVYSYSLADRDTDVMVQIASLMEGWSFDVWCEYCESEVANYLYLVTTCETSYHTSYCNMQRYQTLETRRGSRYFLLLHFVILIVSSVQSITSHWKWLCHPPPPSGASYREFLPNKVRLGAAVLCRKQAPANLNLR